MAQFRIFDVIVDTDRREISADGETLPLEPRGFDVLSYLISHAGRAVPKSELLDQVWQGRMVSDGVITQAVSKARRLFGERADDVIKTVHRVGYLFVGELERLDPANGSGGLRYLLGVGDAESAAAAMETAGVEVMASEGDLPVLLFEDCLAAIRAASELLVLRPAASFSIHLAVWMPGEDDSELALSVAREVARLASPGQILVTGASFEVGRQQLAGSDSPALNWLAHGQYEFQSIRELIRIYEVGAADAPMRQPPDQTDILKVSSQDVILGWRAAPGQSVPHRSQWQLKRALGEGGFGEAWLAVHERTHERRVFKFCYRADRLRSLQREVTLFRLLNETLGQRDDIARILDWNFEETPYFVESEYSGHGDIEQWSEDQGGLTSIGLDTRLALFAQISRAVAAAHAVGVLHKDIKPGNILIRQQHDGSPSALLCDFGIGLITDPEPLDEHGITRQGITEAIAGNVTTSRSGTRRYMAPELLEGHPATMQADIFSLGVVLYQLIVGDFGRVLAPGWERQIGDELLAKDIGAMVDGDPNRRMRDANQVADRIETLEQRRAENAKQQEQQLELQRLERRRKVLLPLAGIACAVAIAMSVLALQIQKQANRADQQTQAAELQRKSAETTAAFLTRLFDASNPYRFSGKDLSAKDLLDMGKASLERDLPNDPRVRSRLFLTIAEAYLGLGAYDEMEVTLGRLESVADESILPADQMQALSLRGQAAALNDSIEQARELLNEALALARSSGDAESEAQIMLELATAESDASQLQAASEWAEQAVDLSVKQFGGESSQTLAAKSTLASILTEQNEFDRAEVLFVDLIGVIEARQNKNWAAVNILNNYTQLLIKLSRFDQAVTYGRRALTLAQSQLPSDHRELATVAGNLGSALNYANNQDEAEEVLAYALDIRQRTLGDHTDTALSHSNLSGFYARHGRWEEAEEHIVQAVNLYRSLLGDSYRTAVSLHDYASILINFDRTEEAIPLLEESVALAESELGNAHWITGAFHAGYAQALTEVGSLDEAIAQAQKGVEIMSVALPEGHFRRAAAHVALAYAYLESGDVGAAKRAFEGQLEAVAAELGKDSAEYKSLQEVNVRIESALKP